MSMRLALSGFSLADLRTLLGGRDPAVVATLEARWAREARGGDETAFAREFREALRQAIEQGAPFDGLDRETAAHALLADWLVDLAGRRPVPDCDLKYVPLLELLDAAGRSPDPSARRSLGYLLEGRPLFGRRPPESPVYGFLTREEALELRARLEALSEEDHDDPDVGEMAADLVEFLDEIASESLDVWAFVD